MTADLIVSVFHQMSLRNRERKKRKAALGKRAEVAPEKCCYKLPPFERCYDPLLHNKYIKAKLRIDKRNLVINEAKSEYYFNICTN